ncbi:hypothetical protein LINPERHAP2_LOCUS34508 [Linum perenne]
MRCWMGTERSKSSIFIGKVINQLTS